MKHVKTLGLLAVAVMAMAAVFGTASASAAKFTAGKVGNDLTEETKAKHVFTITGSNVECTEIGFAGKTEALESETQMVTPSYNGCTAFGFAAQVTNENCTFTLNANGNVTLGPLKGEGTCQFKIEVSNFFATCEVLVKSQGITGAVSYADNAGHITVKVNETAKIDAQVTKSSGLCPLTVGTHEKAATYKGESTVKATGTTIGWDA